MTTLLDYLTATVAAAPDRTAVSEGTSESLSYRELDARSTALAGELVRHGAGPGARVAVHLPAGVDLVVAVWAALRAGAAYVPLDVACPAARLARIVDSARPCAVIGVGDGGTWCDGIPRVDPRGAYEPAPTVAPGPDDPAYVLHTSGSTGTPKGVVLSHRNATAFVDWAVAAFGLTADDRVAGHAPPHFDLSVFDLFGTVKAAATLVPVPHRARVFPAELAAFLRDSRCTVLYCVPSALTLLATSGVAERAGLATLRAVLFAGEPCPPRTLRTMLGLAPGARFANLYGPTETNVCTYHEVDRALDLDRTALPIGRPTTPDVTTLVVADGRPATTGELYVGGPTVAVGYLGDPVGTDRAFVPHPFGGAGRFYRTGDIVSRGPDGLLYFHGRADRQIKTRGHRIELDEVECALAELPEIVEAAVLAVPDDAVTNRLVAYVVTGTPVPTARLRRAVAARLPGYMVPGTIHVLDALPRSTTGKVDRTTLAERDALDGAGHVPHPSNR